MHQYKDKVPDLSHSYQSIGTSCDSKLKLPNLKIYVSKLQKEINVCQHRNCRALKFQWKISVQIMTFCFPF